MGASNGLNDRAVEVGVVQHADGRRGIARDAELIVECLRGGVLRQRGAPDPAVRMLELPGSSSAGLEVWRREIQSLDIVVIPEQLAAEAIGVALNREVRVVYIPNADWAIRGTVAKWVSETSRLVGRGMEVWAKTAAWYARLAEVGDNATLIPWIALDRVDRDRAASTNGPVRFFANLGLGGWQNRRGADIVLAAWRELDAAPTEASLTVKAAQNLPSLEALRQAGAHVVVADWTRAESEAAWLEADAGLYPTRWDGFGLSLSEALNAGCPMIAPDAWPMNEQVIDGHNGLLIARRRIDDMRLAPRCEPNPVELAGAMRRLIDDRALLRRLTAPQPGARIAEQYAMRLQIRARLLGEPTPSVLVIRSDGESTSSVGRRSEDHWAEALTRHGYQVTVIAQREVRRLRGQIEVDAVLTGKPTLSDLDKLRSVAGSAPLICWHHDLTDVTPSRLAWQKAVIGKVELALVPEDQLERFDGLGHVATLMPGPKAKQRRPPLSRRQLEPRIVFLGGTVAAHTAPRLEIVGALAAASLPISVYSLPNQWRELGIETEPPVWDDDAQSVYDGAVGVSVSRGPDSRFYSSNRLFNIGAAGALPLVRTFHGLETLYPPHTCVSFDTADDAVRLARDIVADPAAYESIRSAATEHTWRHHTWDDRISEILQFLPMLRVQVSTAAPATKVGNQPETPAPNADLALPATQPQAERQAPKFADMWNKRAAKLGRRAVGHIAWNDERFARESEELWGRVEPILRRHILPEDRVLLDFGCGVGRYSSRLAALGPTVVGVDQSQAMVSLARDAEPMVRFEVLGDGGRIPLKSKSVDVLWTCTVLQHIPDAELADRLREIRRVLRPGALVVLFENRGLGARTSGSGHVVFRPDSEYTHYFPGTELVDEWAIEREPHFLMAGRVNKVKTARAAGRKVVQ